MENSDIKHDTFFTKLETISVITFFSDILTGKSICDLMNVIFKLERSILRSKCDKHDFKQIRIETRANSNISFLLISDGAEDISGKLLRR